MKFPLSWLKDYIDTQQSPSVIAKTLTTLGIEVENVEKISPGFEGVVVAKVLEVQKHPNADKLSLAMVFDGAQTLQIVCGAPNCRAGMKSALAPVGAQVIDEQGQPLKLKKTKIRGVESNGMLCAAQELGLGHESDGILELADHLKEGSDFAELYSETVFEVGLTPNLGHCSCLLGIARELSAATGEPITYPQPFVRQSNTRSTQEAVKLTVADSHNCPRYACRVFENIRVAPSPDWLKKRLQASGIRPVNNIVDITNYVLLEMGHPLHAFDLDKITDAQIIVRAAEKGEKIVTLDSKERELTPGMLVIADAKRPIAIAGVMGGIDTEVGEHTTRIVLESAYFNPRSIRRTSKDVGLSTDASRRFERHADPNGMIPALDRAAMLIEQVTGVDACVGNVLFSAEEFPKKNILCRVSRVNALLGTHLSISEMESIFHRLEFKTSFDGQDIIKVEVPTYRADITAEVDLVEEIARLYGYDNIPKDPLTKHITSNLQQAPIYLFERLARGVSTGQGLQEFLTCDLIGPKLLEIVGQTGEPPASRIHILNPTSVEQSILRQSLLPGLLQVVKYNVDHQNTSIHGFEVGRIHFKSSEHYKEQSVVGFILYGKHTPHHIDPKPRDLDFYDLKGIIENFLKGMNISDAVFKASALDTFHPGRQASIFVGHQDVGSLGEIHPIIQRRLDVPQRILFAELNLHDLFPLQIGEQKMKPISIYPSTERDWTVTLKEDVPIQEVLSAIRVLSKPILERVFLLDIYRNEKLGADKKNVTLRFVYRDAKKTISQEVADAEHERLISAAKKVLDYAIIEF